MIAPATLNLDLQRIVRSIPGYDPFAQAGECYFDETTAAGAIAFVEEYCTHVKGKQAGQPLLLEPWQKAVIANLFGWKRPDGTRRYREALVYVARKNGKTALAAALVCLVMFTDGEPGCEAYSSAAEREQARLCFDVVSSMIRANPEMAKAAQLYRYSVVVGSGSYKAISADAGTKHGFNAHLIVNDELHAHRTPELTEVLMTSTGARRQPLVVHLTTADYDRENSVCNQKYEYAKKVCDNSKDPAKGISDASFLPVIYEAGTDDDWTSPETWRKANPNLGVSVSEEYLRHECQRAVDDLSFRPTFQRLHLNVRTKARNAWIAPEKWSACGEAAVDAESLAGEACGAGLDLSAKYDLTAFVLAFPDGQFYKLLPFFWMPEEAARERDRKDRIPYTQWARDGWLKVTPGASVDYDLVESDIKALCEKYQVRRVAFDPWNANATRTRLEGHGIEMAEFPQNLKMFNEPTKEFGRLIAAGLLHHGNHPVLNWCAENVAVYTDASGNIRPVKPEEHSPNKIDGIVAGVMALWADMTTRGGTAEVSYYETHDVEFV